MTTSGETAGLTGATPNFEYTNSKRPVISGSSSTRKLNENESGSVVMLDRFAGTTFTLPAGIPGINFDFVSSITSNTMKVVTNITTSTPIIIGTIGVGYSPNLATNGAVVFKGISTDAFCSVNLNGGTTGGAQGSRFTLTALSSGTWFISGLLVGTGTLATPLAITA